MGCQGDGFQETGPHVANPFPTKTVENSPYPPANYFADFSRWVCLRWGQPGGVPGHLVRWAGRRVCCRGMVTITDRNRVQGDGHRIDLVPGNLSRPAAGGAPGAPAVDGIDHEPEPGPGGTAIGLTWCRVISPALLPEVLPVITRWMVSITNRNGFHDNNQYIYFQD